MGEVIGRIIIPRAGTLKSVMLFMEGNPSFDLKEPREVEEGDLLYLELRKPEGTPEPPVPEPPVAEEIPPEEELPGEEGS